MGEVELEVGVSQAVDTGEEQRSGEGKGEALENKGIGRRNKGSHTRINKKGHQGRRSDRERHKGRS